jgi:hypothetical protein
VSKRAPQFERVPSDRYNTPLGAVLPLLPHLSDRTRFIESCCGEGDLVDHLTAAGHVCVGKYDLPVDARTAIYNIPKGAIFITNPPYWGKPRDLHPLIENLASQAEAWLLMNADWIHNLSSAPVITRHLRTIVSVGRVKWLAGTPHVSMDNAIWCRFGAPMPGYPIQFICRGMETLVEAAA